MEILIGVAVGAGMLWAWSARYRAAKFLVIVAFGALAIWAGVNLDRANQPGATTAQTNVTPARSIPCDKAAEAGVDAFNRALFCGHS